MPLLWSTQQPPSQSSNIAKELLKLSDETFHEAHGKQGFVIPTKSFVKIGIIKIFCYNNKMFGSINNTFGCCGKIFGCSNKNFICCP